MSDQRGSTKPTPRPEGARRARVAAAALAAALALGACASASGPGAPAPGGGDGADHADAKDHKGPSKRARSEPAPDPALSLLFISPQGEPFRAIKGAPSPAEQWFNRVDAKHEGKISLDEFLADSAAFFARLDADKKGYVDSADVTNMHAKLAPEVLETYGPLEDFVGTDEAARRARMADASISEATRSALFTRPIGAQPFTWLNEIEPIMSDDLDLDGKVTLEEFQAAARRRFAKLDVNHDGYFELSEAPKPIWFISHKRD